MKNHFSYLQNRFSYLQKQNADYQRFVFLGAFEGALEAVVGRVTSGWAGRKDGAVLIFFTILATIYKRRKSTYYNYV